MILHLNQELFREIIEESAGSLQIPVDIIEKDYFVSLVLLELSKKLPDMVFKGGTSLSKCFRSINRFSEDIDISYPIDIVRVGESKKRALKKAIVETMNELSFPVNNLEQSRSRRNYNQYRCSYPSLFPMTTSLRSELIIETYVAILSFPTELREVNSYIHMFLKEKNLNEVINEYQLKPFPLRVQSMNRTFVDKVFAICDYYLAGKISGHSRHLYDISQIMPVIVFDDTMRQLVKEVRIQRAVVEICISAKEGVSINNTLKEIIHSNAYERDYKNITRELLFIDYDYNEVIASINSIIESGLFE